jgi:ABC-type Fe3+ transport system substrate-binding protein
MQGHGAWIDVPTTAYPPLVQGGCITSGAAHPARAAAFRAFLLGDEARALLAQAGFVVDAPVQAAKQGGPDDKATSAAPARPSP